MYPTQIPRHEQIENQHPKNFFDNECFPCCYASPPNFSMSKHGSNLQTYNNELVKTVEELRYRRAVLQDQISKEETEKRALQTQIHNLSETLTKINESLAKKIQLKEEYERIIVETDKAYQKILESSQILLNVVKQESSHLTTANDKKKIYVDYEQDALLQTYSRTVKDKKKRSDRFGERGQERVFERSDKARSDIDLRQI